jgi:hypothetical protein
LARSGAVRKLAMRSIEAGLDEVLAFRLGDERLELGGGEGVDQTSLGDDEEEDLCAGECAELVCLIGSVRRSKKRDGSR